ncbi:exonuclease domain-containing protein [Paenibacillus oenotherae]|uniref:Exonuclease domain-containing protein n=1 Tax=Paenibacillus oenotherae TaxID=1435645 RepID=A0ABS7D1G0_9BACL|nr:3'-5' exonuclease [Paenibacillus oenotherae]MBW7473779.1 exonuclease domain-containing protein [Paenibacillus oenotherae]
MSDYIILDIEFNGRKFASDKPMEVIEIGAVRLDSSLQPIDEFAAFIKPIYFSKLNGFIKKKTGIPQEEIDRAPRFPAVIAAFIQWLNRSGNFTLITWGGEDLKRIVFDTRMHKLDDSFWLSVDYFDLLKGFLRAKNLTNDVSVEGALLELGIPMTGSAHRALDDARMTADVFRNVIDGLDFSHIQQFKDVYSNAKERRMVKVAVRNIYAQKKIPVWEAVVEHYLKDKISLDDPRKIAELQHYFADEVNSRHQQLQAERDNNPASS